MRGPNYRWLKLSSPPFTTDMGAAQIFSVAKTKSHIALDELGSIFQELSRKKVHTQAIRLWVVFSVQSQYLKCRETRPLSLKAVLENRDE
jgi:hypothetical protein